MPRATHKAITVDLEVFNELKHRAGQESVNTRLRKMLKLPAGQALHSPRKPKGIPMPENISQELILARVNQVAGRLGNFQVMLRQKGSNAAVLCQMDKALRAIDVQLQAVEER